MDEDLNSEINKLEFDMNAHSPDGDLKLDFLLAKNSEHLSKVIDKVIAIDGMINAQRTILIALVDSNKNHWYAIKKQKSMIYSLIAFNIVTLISCFIGLIARKPLGL